MKYTARCIIFNHTPIKPWTWKIYMFPNNLFQFTSQYIQYVITA